MKAIHFICRRDVDGIHLNGLSVVEGAPKLTYRSCCWAISVADAEALVGGWLYLHPKKTGRSEFGGRILSFEAGQEWPGTVNENRIAFFVEPHTEGRGQIWRGTDYGMAWTGGLVEVSLRHESARPAQGI
jgi:hypothetical protein